MGGETDETSETRRWGSGGACRGLYLCTILMTDRSVMRLWLMSSSLSVHEELSVRYWMPASLTLKRSVMLHPFPPPPFLRKEYRRTPTWCRARRSGASGTSAWRRISSWRRLTWGTRRRGASGGLASSCTAPANWRPSAGCYLKPGVDWREALLVLRDRCRVGKSHPRV